MCDLMNGFVLNYETIDIAFYVMSQTYKKYNYHTFLIFRMNVRWKILHLEQAGHGIVSEKHVSVLGKHYYNIYRNYLLGNSLKLNTGENKCIFLRIIFEMPMVL